jgi:hypothetical protein
MADEHARAAIKPHAHVQPRAVPPVADRTGAPSAASRSESDPGCVQVVAGANGFAPRGRPNRGRCRFSVSNRPAQPLAQATTEVLSVEILGYDALRPSRRPALIRDHNTCHRSNLPGSRDVRSVIGRLPVGSSAEQRPATAGGQPGRRHGSASASPMAAARSFPSALFSSWRTRSALTPSRPAISRRLWVWPSSPKRAGGDV